jgi:hypothetical protein
MLITQSLDLLILDQELLLTADSGIAPSMITMIIGRVIGGVGGAGCQALVSLIIVGM